MRISQSSFIAFAILVGFFVFITMRGELPAYIGVFLGNAQSGSGGAGGSGFNLGNILQSLPQIIPNTGTGLNSNSTTQEMLQVFPGAAGGF